MNHPERLCINCVHSRANGAFLFCDSPHAAKPSPVDGKPQAVACSAERTFGACAENGAFFEPAQPIIEPPAPEHAPMPSVADALAKLFPASTERAKAQQCMRLVLKLLKSAETEAIAASLNLPDAELHRNRVREHLASAETMLQAANAAEFRAQRMEGAS